MRESARVPEWAAVAPSRDIQDAERWPPERSVTLTMI